MAAGIQAIETHYNGYRFRSRLEARWAVFFDAIGWEWQYELQGYVVNGNPYLPDFYIPEFGLVAEVKPDNNITDEGLEKIHDRLYALTASGELALIWVLLQGVPDNMMYGMGTMLGGGKASAHAIFAECPFCHRVCILFGEPDFSPKRLYCPCTFPHRAFVKFPYIWECTESPLVLTAYDKARSARFEHGETPRVPRGKPR